VNADTAHTLNQRLLANLNSNTTDLAQGELAVAAEVFFDPARFAAEKAALFHRVPQPVAFAAEIPEPGSFLTLDVLDVPLLVTRSESGQLNAFINACAHRGARVATGSGECRRLICGFHGWAYSLEGELVGRPQERCFNTPREQCGLQRLPVSEKFGVVVVAMSPQVSQYQVDTALDELADDLDALQLAQFHPLERRQLSVQANWKLVNDLSLESYHFNVLHRDSVATVLAPNAVVDTFGHTSRWAFPFKTINRLETLSDQDWPTGIEGSCTYTLYPGVMLIVNATGAQLIRAEPGSAPGHSNVSYVGICAADADREAVLAGYNFGGEVFQNEDLPMAEQCQRGLEAGQRPLVIGTNEPLLQIWHRLWDEAL